MLQAKAKAALCFPVVFSSGGRQGHLVTLNHDSRNWRQRANAPMENDIVNKDPEKEVHY